MNRVGPVVRVPTGFAVVQRVPERADRALGSLEIAAVVADAGVKYTVSVDGFAESNTALNTMTKPEGWNQDPARHLRPAHPGRRQRDAPRSRGCSGPSSRRRVQASVRST